MRTSTLHSIAVAIACPGCELALYYIAEAIVCPEYELKLIYKITRYTRITNRDYARERTRPKEKLNEKK